MKPSSMSEIPRVRNARPQLRRAHLIEPFSRPESLMKRGEDNYKARDCLALS